MSSIRSTMLRAAWFSVLALARPCWAYPSITTTCEEFARGTNFDPVDAVGEWFIALTDTKANISGNSTIRELTSSELQLYDEILKSYSKDKLKLEFKMRASTPIDFETNSVIVPQDKAGNVDAWVTYVESGNAILSQSPSQFTLKWKRVDGFLALMLCSGPTSRDHTLVLLSKTAIPDRVELLQAVDKLDITGIKSSAINFSST